MLFDTMLNIKRIFVVTSKNVSVLISSVLLSGSASSFNIPMKASMTLSFGMLVYRLLTSLVTDIMFMSRLLLSESKRRILLFSFCVSFLMCYCRDQRLFLTYLSMP